MANKLELSKNDEALVEEFMKQLNLKVEKFSKKILRLFKNQTPDFKVKSIDNYYFYCEVKSLFTEIPNTGILHKKISSIILEKLSEAYYQFESVNKSHEVPNVLVFVTHTAHIDFKEYINTLYGDIVIPDRIQSIIPQKIIASFKNTDSFKRAMEKGFNIDLAIWFFIDNSDPRYILTTKEKKFKNYLSRIFQMKGFKYV